MAKTTEAVVIGGGVMGASILYNLALRGVQGPVLLERDTLGSGSTGRSSGFIRMHYSTAVNTELALKSYPYFINFNEIVGGEVSFVKTGYLVIAPPESIGGLEHNVSIQKSVGVDTDIISVREARELVPGFVLKEDEGFAWEPGSGHADPSGTAIAYSSRARELGAYVALESPALDVETSGGRVVAVKTEKERYETPIAVVATGPWSPRFLPKLGLDLPLEATRHEVFLLKRPPDPVPAHPGVADLSNLTYFRQEGSDLTLLGNGNVEDVVDPDNYNPRPGMDHLQDLWVRLTKRVPAMESAEFFTGFAGLYTSTPDLHPIVDKVDGVEGLYVCTGFSGHGFKLAPAVGIVMSELILDGEAKTVDITPLRISRFAEGDLNPITYKFRVIA
ncbi:MAG: FAD-binding oxidoreductase [Chloroflexi bacterium]|nr:FAD-binding oxidoreductase [Chloroflexota bacterium]